MIALRRVPTAEESSAKKTASKRPRCYICPRSADNKTRTRCYICDQPSCVTHTKIICEQCITEEVMDSPEEQEDEIIADDASD